MSVAMAESGVDSLIKKASFLPVSHGKSENFEAFPRLFDFHY